ncbi:MAG: hypothetical protein AB1486_19900 [Planctomycetota bacterium]
MTREVVRTLVELFRPTVLDEVAVRVTLARAGFTGPQVAFLNLYGILRKTASQPPNFIEATLELLLDCPDPDLALNNLEHLVLRHYADRDLPWSFTGETYRALITLLGSSQALADSLIRRPDLITVLSEPAVPPARDALLAAARACVAPEDEPAARPASLKRFAEREMIRLAALDLVSNLDIVKVSRLTSQLADAILQGALDAAWLELQESEPSRPPSFSFAVIGLGKLGGDELNYSSDVDLLFIHHSEEETDVPQRLARHLVRLLSHRDAEGQLLRVDLRLRPEGDAGPITRPLAATLRYYRERGEPWEKQMLVKARPVAGDLELGHQFLEEVRPFLIGAYLDSKAIGQIQELRRQMEAAARRDGEDHLEIKRGPGGIRDIEYTVQFLQLLHAGTHPSLIHHNTMESLVRLERVKAITREERETLSSAYRFLRRVENRLQLYHRIATHRVPTDEEALRRLARSLGYSLQDPLPAFRDDLDEHRRQARAVYMKLLGGLFAGVDGERGETYDLILDPAPDDAAIQRVLGRYGFHEAHTAYLNLKRMGESGSQVLPTSPRTRKFFASVVPEILSYVAKTPDPDQALCNLERIARGTGGKAIFFRLLHEEPSVLQILADIAGHSQQLSDILIREPETLDPFVDSLLVQRRGERRRARRLTLDHLKDAADPLVVLMDHKTLETLRIGTRDIQQKATILETLFALSRLATTIIKRAWAYVAEHHPQRTAPCRAAVLAVGKLGGLEINYGSDVDLLFIMDDCDQPAEAAAFWTDRAQSFIRALSTMGASGRLYRVDTRLRPEGESGPLVSSFKGFRDYYASDRAHLFEFQSLLRLRYVAGDRELGSRIARTIRNDILGRTFGDEVREPVLAMRRRLEEEGRGRDLKRGPGGLVDIEFIVQYLQLRFGAERGDLRNPNTVRSLELLQRAGLLLPEQAHRLLEAYTFLRKVEARLQIVYGLDREALPSDAESLAKLARRLGFADREDCGAALLESYDRHARRVRETYQDVVAGGLNASLVSPGAPSRLEKREAS